MITVASKTLGTCLSHELMKGNLIPNKFFAQNSVKVIEL